MAAVHPPPAAPPLPAEAYVEFDDDKALRGAQAPPPRRWQPRRHL